MHIYNYPLSVVYYILYLEFRQILMEYKVKRLKIKYLNEIEIHNHTILEASEDDDQS